MYSNQHSLMDSDSGGCTGDEIQEMMMKKAYELFAVCDVEGKGFINKRDMQRLQTELPLSPDQLIDVFDSLDDDGNGFLTLHEFTEGFGSFLGVSSPSAIEKERSLDIDAEKIYEDEHEDATNDEEHFDKMLGQLGATEVLDDVDVVKTMWAQLKRDQPELLNNFEDFLVRITTELKRTHTDYKSLELALRSKSCAHDEEVRKLYEEMEQQINTEKQRVLAEEKARERQLKEEMDRELREKDKQLQELLNHHVEMERKLAELNSQDTETKQENEKLKKKKVPTATLR